MFFFSRVVGRCIVPAQKRFFPQLDLSLLDDSDFKVTEFHHFLLSINRDTKIDVLHLHHPSERFSSKYIVYFQPNDMAYEEILPEVLLIMKALKCHVVLFNYRGVSKSIGRLSSSSDLVDDGVAVVSHLISSQHIPSKDIILRGRSLGAAVAIMTAAALHKKNRTVRVFADRTFASLSLCIYGLIRTCFENPDKLGCRFNPHQKIGNLVANVLFPLIWFITHLTSWEMEVFSAYSSLPEETKEYLQVVSPKQECDFIRKDSRHLDDLLIHRSASLYTAEKPIRRALKERGDEEALAQMRRRRLQGSASTEGHQTLLQHLYLRSTPEISGEEAFLNIARRWSSL